jgi:hypothetical protein
LTAYDHECGGLSPKARDLAANMKSFADDGEIAPALKNVVVLFALLSKNKFCSVVNDQMS